MTIADELRAYDATHNAIGAHAMMRKGADVVDDLLEALQGLMNHFDKASYDEAFAKARAAISKALGNVSAPRFANVSCSQCGAEFGPGDHGFSHCSHHGGKE